MEEGDIYAAGAARTLIASFLTSRLPGSLYDAIVDNGKLAAGAPSIAFIRVAPKTFTLTIGADVAPDIAPETVLAAISDLRRATGRIPASRPNTLTRLKTRFADGLATGSKDPRVVYSRLVGWLAGRSRYENLARWPQQIDAVTHEQVAAMMKGLSGPGRIVTGTLMPAKEATP